MTYKCFAPYTNRFPSKPPAGVWYSRCASLLMIRSLKSNFNSNLMDDIHLFYCCWLAKLEFKTIFVHVFGHGPLGAQSTHTLKILNFYFTPSPLEERISVSSSSSNTNRDHGSSSLQRKGYFGIRHPIQPQPTSMAQDHPRPSRWPDLQAREKGRYTIPDWCCTPWLPRNRTSQGRYRYVIWALRHSREMEILMVVNRKQGSQNP